MPLFRVLCLAILALFKASYTFAASAPLVGVTVLTEYVPNFDGTTPDWHWTSSYQNSATYYDFNQMAPTLGFYEQTQGNAVVQQNHYKQLQAAHADYALFSWFGDLGQYSDESIDSVLSTYWAVFSANNANQTRHAIKMAVILEKAETNYQSRINYLSTIYHKYSKDLLTYSGKAIIVLSFGTSDQSVISAVVHCAENHGLYAVNAEANATTGNAAFSGITMLNNDPNRITPFAGVVSPSVDVTGVQTQNLLVAENLPSAALEAEKLPLGCGQVIKDITASGSLAVASTYTLCQVVSTDPSKTLVTSQIPTSANYRTEWYVVFRIRSPDPNQTSGTLSVQDSCGIFTQALSPVSFQSNTASMPPVRNRFMNFVLKYSLLCQYQRSAIAPISAQVFISTGHVAVDRIWITNSVFWKPSIADYDAQWVPIVALPIQNRPQFITVASLNSWGEGTAIESNTYFGTQFLDRTAYWVNLVKSPSRLVLP